MTSTETPVRVPIDPRIRERRIAVRRDEGRRRLRLLLGAGAVVAVALLGWLATRSPLLDVDRVRVAGARRTSGSEIRAAAGIRHGEAMVDVDESGTARRLRALPWVDRATVRREWPGTVVITVTERRPAASVRAVGGGWMLVDRTGRLLARQPEPQPGLPAIEGGTFASAPGATIAAAGRGALAVARLIPATRVNDVPVVAVVGGGELELRLANGPGKPNGVARLGPPDDLAEKLVAVFTVLDRVDRRALAVVDVRVPSAPVVTRQP